MMQPVVTSILCRIIIHGRTSVCCERLHYQLNYPQGKLIRVANGRALDVAVDIRVNSPTFGEHVAVEVSSENHKQLWIPPGCAHGFVALSDSLDFLYKTTEFHAPPMMSIAYSGMTKILA